MTSPLLRSSSSSIGYLSTGSEELPPYEDTPSPPSYEETMNRIYRLKGLIFKDPREGDPTQYCHDPYTFRWSCRHPPLPSEC